MSKHGFERVRASAPSIVKTRRERFATWLAIALTVIFLGGVEWHSLQIIERQIADGNVAGLVGSVVFLTVITVLVAGALVYQVCRVGYLSRRGADATDRFQAARDFLEERHGPAVTILVPSYREQPEIVRQALVSAILQDCPNRNVVLLIDDPPTPTSEDDRVLLQQTRAMVHDLETRLVPVREDVMDLYARLSAGLARGDDPAAWEHALAYELRRATAWLRELAETFPSESHTDALFHREILDRWIVGLESVQIGSGRLSRRVLEFWAWRLRALFDVRVSSFERKQWVNLSHEANKAMNLNAYLGLLGGTYVAKEDPSDGQVLLKIEHGRGELSVPDADYVVTLDADSLLSPHYVVRLVAELERPELAAVAVIQTPYSAIPHAPGRLERAAGATTDLQYIVHQGFTRWNATFWVGANALLRVAAIRSIATTDLERGWPIQRFVQDRTVIEDTESSIDLASAGWTLHNVPERLSWSATPPDFGALVIQRRRWANGGLLIAPKLWPLRRRSRAENVFRGHYLLSPTISNLAVLLLVCLPLGPAHATMWAPLCALPYFWLQHRDMRSVGYGRTEIFRVFALNLLLVPVNLGGVAKSVQQALTKRKTPFARTPKIADRTYVPVPYIVAPIAVGVASFAAGLLQVANGNHFNGVAGTLFGFVMIVAAAGYIGVRNAATDILFATQRVTRQRAPRRRSG
jgi:cellulose synthase/poly-beta-1,6-N-acetylglucosamine synthase-like glycosyltransferase